MIADWFKLKEKRICTISNKQRKLSWTFENQPKDVYRKKCTLYVSKNVSHLGIYNSSTAE